MTANHKMPGTSRPLSLRRRLRDVTVNVKSSRNHNAASKMSQLVTQSFYDYFAVRYLRTKHPVCAIANWIYWRVDGGDRELRVPEKALLNCFHTSARFVSIPLCLRTTGDRGSAHANALFIDVQACTAERFEPHGARAYSMFSDYEYEALDNALAAYFAKKTINLKYIAPSAYSPVIGPQALEHYIEERGYCAAWSMWYTDMRLTYPDVPRNKLVIALVNKLSVKLKNGSLSVYLLDYVNQVYQLMISEFPQYHDMFLNFDTYLLLPHTTRKGFAFSAFQKRMFALITKQPMTRIHIENSMRFKTPTQLKSKDFKLDTTKAQKIRVTKYTKK